MSKKIIFLTGGSGFLGREITNYLISDGFAVRILTRDPSRFKDSEHINYVKGDILDTSSLKRHLSGCYGVIHAAGEKNDVSKMEAINVEGTKNICEAANESAISYFCYVSSVGVIGLTNETLITEQTKCNPVNFYEKTKLEGELYFLENFNLNNCSSVILRPTNVFGKTHLTYNNSITGKIKSFIKGNEIANYIYVKDVAYACVFFINQNNLIKEIFTLNDSLLNNNFKAIKGIATKTKTPLVQAPLFLPWLLRFIKLGKNNLGNKFYSNSKLLKTGFNFPYGLEKGIIDALK
ncbi:NAD-dependent epimerase/dehydratase family protein [Olleya namhaensis]|uniref:NAD-dependent epimerase/dehydratase family protein n=1 Tax=Olleya namhaensis TaxID=1144750 RepID=UPI0024929CF2|nr:NAD(P)-dependent oxidoreductase [Olleya namhaensis]